MRKTFLTVIITIICGVSNSFSMPLSPESISRLKTAGRLEPVAQRFEQAHLRGIDAAGESILSSMRKVNRDNPDEITLSVPVILVDFNDNEANDEEYDVDHFEELLFSLNEIDPGSMREWYRENSYDEVDIVGEVVGWVRLEHDYAYYVDGQNGVGDYPRNSQGMVREAVIAADDQIDYSDFDNNNDGSVDALYVVHSGPGAEANNGDEDMIWSHAWSLNFNRIRLDGVYINRYSTEPEDGQVGVFGHELGHAMFGLPDLYDRDYSSEGIGNWSMMSGGSWGDEGRSPAHFDAWCKIQAGFIQPEIIEGNLANVVVPPVETEAVAFKLWQDGNPGRQYFLVENRQQVGFDASLPGSGLIVYHVDENVNEQNDEEWYPGHQDEGHYLVALEQADGNWDMEHDENRGDDGDPFPGSSGNNVFDLESTPNSRDYNNQSTDVSIWNIHIDELNVICNMEVLPGVPEIVDFDPNVLEVELMSGTSDQLELNIVNCGDAVLHFRIEAVGEQPDWITWNPEEGFISPDEEIDVILDLNAENLEPGEYEGSLYILTNDPNNEEIDFSIMLMVIEDVHRLRFFTDFIQTDVNHSVLIPEVRFEQEIVPQGWEVGVFTPTDILSGGVVWDGEGPIGLSTWGDDANTQDVVEGFHAGERMRFNIWDFEADQEYESIASILEGSLNWVVNGFTVLNLYAGEGEILAVPLDEGWNMISLNVSPAQQFYRQDEERGPDVVIMMEQLRIDENNHRVFLVKDEDGQFYNPEFGFNGIPYWNLTRGYQVKVTADVEARWAGDRIAADADIPLRHGWNLVAYYPTYELNADFPDYYVLSPIIDFVEIAKDNDGHFLVPDFNYSDMPPWHETQGYLVKIRSDEPIVLNYPAEQVGIVGIQPPSDDYNMSNHWTTPNPTSRNMSILIEMTDETIFGSNDQAAAFSAEGRLVGAGHTSEDGRFGFPVWGDDPTTELIDGLIEGESFRLIVWQSEKQCESVLKVAEIEYGSSVTYQTDGFLALKMTRDDHISEQYYLTHPYPNPFNAITSVQYGIPEFGRVTLRVYDTSGRIVSILFDGFQTAGRHSTTWNGETFPTGLYLIELKSGRNTVLSKAALVK